MNSNKEQTILIPKKKRYLSSLVFALLILVVVLFLICPCWKEIKKESENLLLERKEIALLKAQAEGIKVFKSNYDKYLSDLENIEKMFVDSNEPLGLIEFLEKLAIDTNVDIKLSSFIFSEQDGSKIINLQIFSNGGFLNNLNFLEKLEKSPFLIKVQNLAISSFEEKKGQKNNDVQFKFLIKVFAK